MKGKERKQSEFGKAIQQKINPSPRFEIDFDKVEKWEDIKLIFEVVRFTFTMDHKSVERIKHFLKPADETPTGSNGSF